MPRIDPPSSLPALSLPGINSQSAANNKSLATEGARNPEIQSNQYGVSGAPLSTANLQKRPGWANNIAEKATQAPSLCPAGMPWTAESKAGVALARFIDTTGQPFVTLDSVEVVNARCANELLLEAVEKNSLSVAELFVKCPQRSRDTVKVGHSFSGEWFTHIRLGENVEIGNDVNLLGHGFIELHDNVRIGDDVSITTIGHPNDPDLRHTAFTGSVIIQEDAQIGAGSILSPRAGETLVIPKDARIPNNSIILKSVPEANATKGAGLCSMECEPFDTEGYLVIDTLEKAQSIFQSKEGNVNVDIKLPIYFKGDPDLLTVVGQGRIGINRKAKFELEGSLTMNVPFQMASRATVQVLPGANAILDAGAFVYTGAYVELGDGARIGKDSIVAAGAYIQRSLQEGEIFVGDDRIVAVPGKENRKAGRIAGKITDKKYETVPDEWKDRDYLPPKVKDFKKYKDSKASMSNEKTIQFALSSAQELFKHRSLPFVPESVYLAAEFLQLDMPLYISN